MRAVKTIGLVLLVIVAVGAAGFSLYRTFIYQEPDGLTEEQRAKAMKAVADFKAPSVGGSSKGGQKK